MSSSYLPERMPDQEIRVPRGVLKLLSMLGLSTNARRVLDILWSIHDEETGVASISQDEMCTVLGSTKPTVNRAFQVLRESGVAWLISQSGGEYQLHPVLTGGLVSSPVMSVPQIKGVHAEEWSEQRRAMYEAQIANLAPTA